MNGPDYGLVWESFSPAVLPSEASPMRLVKLKTAAYLGSSGFLKPKAEVNFEVLPRAFKIL